VWPAICNVLAIFAAKSQDQPSRNQGSMALRDPARAASSESQPRRLIWRERGAAGLPERALVAAVFVTLAMNSSSCALSQLASSIKAWRRSFVPQKVFPSTSAVVPSPSPEGYTLDHVGDRGCWSSAG
jgi:hypothetical protein